MVVVCLISSIMYSMKQFLSLEGTDVSVFCGCGVPY